MPGVDGLEATRRLVRSAPSSVHVLILTTFDLDEYVYEAMLAGASGFLVKDVPPAELSMPPLPGKPKKEKFRGPLKPI